MEKFLDIFRIPELRKRVLLTLALLAVYRVGAVIPIPGVNADAVRALFQAHSNNLFGVLDMFSGGALGRFSIFSMGVMPYINASIILSLLQGAHVMPALDRLAKEGELGRRKLNQYTRYLSLILALIQSAGLTVAVVHMPVPGNLPIVDNPTPLFYAVTVLTLITGTTFIMWIGEQITEYGIGNGISLIIFAGIVNRLPSAAYSLEELIRLDELSLLSGVGLVALVLAVTAAVVWVETATRKIPVQYAKRMVGRKMMGGQSTNLPLKVDQSGVIAVIFAMSILAVPLTVGQFMQHAAWSQFLNEFINGRDWKYYVLYASLIIFFCYFYNSVSINPDDLADNLKKWGGFIPGIRPGPPTSQYINWVMERITLGGALFVAAVSILPDMLRQAVNAPFFFGGTALLIVVGVALDTIGQLEAHRIMRHYEGFLKRGGSGAFKGRWFNIGES